MTAAPVPAPRTVVEAFLPLDGEVGLDLVYGTANAAGLADQPVRLAIRRLVAAGDVEQRGRGRAGTLRLTGAGRAQLDRDRLALRLARAQDTGRAPWDGSWHLLAVSVEESARAVRDAWRRELSAIGAAPVSTGLHVSAHDLSALLATADRRHLVLATTDRLEVRGTSDPLALAERLWPAAPVDRAYDALADALARPPAQDPLVQQLRLADALERAVRDDPLLPPELRPQPWRPAQLRRRWYAAWTALAEQLGTRTLYRGWWDA
ncbi:phenylacetic acid degradation operon negative regulatory protein [Kineococcus radiotolerans]|uniref:Phenylacetic acid degradation operon negative regulatory protein n=1 Tax=Kineococcus radiotolerans TaxID=131568 RepID=A0A7W4TQ07_KINRA|nr:PaaX family transcriptional regulator [Kineococcus radiotolerans]MBB2902990.1 phenylacetic acid degradation operon negative regulatory protein [Kineococcus radiotolerans]